MNRTLALLRDSLIKSLCWAILAGCVYWALVQWAPSTNPDWASHLTDTTIVETETGYLVINADD